MSMIDPVRAALAAVGITVRLLVGDSAAESVALARQAVADGADLLVALGGDGLVHCAVQALCGTRVPVAVVPAGTGNDLAAALGLPAAPTEVARMIRAGWLRRIDAGFVSPAVAVGDPLPPPAPRPAGTAGTADLGAGDAGTADAGAGGRWWSTVLCAGFDSAVAERANRLRWPGGPRRYDLAIFVELARLHPRTVELSLDGETRILPVTLVAIGNGPLYGGGLRMCPGARLDDGLFDVTVVGPVSRRLLVRLKPMARTGRHIDHPAVTVFRARQVRLAAPGLSAYADGERVGPLPVTVTAVPGALRLFVPAPARSGPERSLDR